jgi:hypothetical protein
MKRIVLTIVEASREVSDAWKRRKTQSELERVKFLNAMSKLEKAVERLDRMRDETTKTQ